MRWRYRKRPKPRMPGIMTVWMGRPGANKGDRTQTSSWTHNQLGAGPHSPRGCPPSTHTLALTFVWANPWDAVRPQTDAKHKERNKASLQKHTHKRMDMLHATGSQTGPTLVPKEAKTSVHIGVSGCGDHGLQGVPLPPGNQTEKPPLGIEPRTFSLQD